MGVAYVCSFAGPFMVSVVSLYIFLLVIMLFPISDIDDALQVRLTASFFPNYNADALHGGFLFIFICFVFKMGLYSYTILCLGSSFNHDLL